MMSRKANSLTIRTPEGVAFSLTLAGPTARLVACGLDFLVKMTVFNVLNILVTVMYHINQDFALGMRIVMYFVVSIGYAILLEWLWQGQTLGKRLMRLRVMDAQGLRIQFNQIVIRNLLRAVDFLPAFYFVGGVACFLSKRSQRLGDLAANTIVVRIPKISEPNLQNLLKGKYNSLKEYPHLCARLRQNVSPHEADMAMQALIRRDELDAAARVELFGKLAEYFKEILIFPQEATESIPDEQYVRNVVEVLFRK